MLTRLFAHLAWADDTAIAALRATATPPASALRAMAHIIGAEEVWSSRIRTREARSDVWPSLTLDEIAALSMDVRAGLADLAAAADADAATAARPISYRNSAGQPFTTRLDDILMHLALHGAYHRGQVASTLREHGDIPRATDYIVFVRESAPIRAAKTTR